MARSIRYLLTALVAVALGGCSTGPTDASPTQVVQTARAQFSSALATYASDTAAALTKLAADAGNLDAAHADDHQLSLTADRFDTKVAAVDFPADMAQSALDLRHDLVNLASIYSEGARATTLAGITSRESEARAARAAAVGHINVLLTQLQITPTLKPQT